MSAGSPAQGSRTLAHWLAAGRLEPSSAAVADGLIAAVAKLHAEGKVHGALSPETVALDAAGKVRLLGGGRAKSLVRDGTGAWELYAAPEQVRGKKAGRQADLFCLGLLLYKVTTGRHPFAAATRGDAMAAVLFKETPEDASGLVQRCLDKRAEKRTVDVTKPVPAPAARPRKKHTRDGSAEGKGWGLSLPRRHLLAALGAAGLALAVVGAGYGARRWRSHDLDKDIATLETLANAGRPAALEAALAAAKARHGDLAVFDRLSGDAACARKRFEACAASYERALAKEPGLAHDPALAEHLLAAFDRSGTLSKSALASLAGVLGRFGDTAVAPLAERTRRGHAASRWNAVRALEAMGHPEAVDYVAVFTEDLKHGDCERRRQAVARLGQLGDPRGLDALREEAREVEASLMERFCVGRDAERAIAAIERKKVNGSAQ